MQRSPSQDNINNSSLNSIIRKSSLFCDDIGSVAALRLLVTTLKMNKCYIRFSPTTNQFVVFANVQSSTSMFSMPKFIRITLDNIPTVVMCAEPSYDDAVLQFDGATYKINRALNDYFKNTINLTDNDANIINDMLQNPEVKEYIIAKEFLDAARDNKIHIVTRYINMAEQDGKYKIDVRDFRGNTALIRAAWINHENIFSMLLDAQADINIANNDGDTALIIATCSSHGRIFSMLLNAHADINIANNKGNTALISATYFHRGSSAYILRLLNAQADINIANNAGETALIIAAKLCYGGVLSILLNANADVNVADNIGNTALMAAAEFGYVDIVSRLLKVSDIDLTKKNSYNHDAYMMAKKSSDNCALLIKKAMVTKEFENAENAEKLKVLALCGAVRGQYCNPSSFFSSIPRDVINSYIVSMISGKDESATPSSAAAASSFKSN